MCAVLLRASRHSHGQVLTVMDGGGISMSSTPKGSKLLRLLGFLRARINWWLVRSNLPCMLLRNFMHAKQRASSPGLGRGAQPPCTMDWHAH